jgi:selenocysteine lyase/cysteine desulfurase
MERRSFVKSLAAAAMAAPFVPELGQALSMQLDQLRAQLQAIGNDQALWQRVRGEFLLDPGLIHLNCGSLGASPRPVIEAVASYLRQLESDPVHNEWGGLGEGMEEVRAQAAAFIGAQIDELALTRNTTEGMNAIADGLDLKKGDEVLTTNHEHGGGMVCWQSLASRRGVKIRYLEMPVPLRDQAQFLELVEQHITRRTRVCSFSHVDTITGAQLPLAGIARITRPRNILLVCDGAQAPGMLQVDVKALGVDAYASSSHKWMLAPKGCGLLYIRKEVQKRVRPTLLYDGYGAYTASVGTRDVAQILGHGVAMDFHNAIGRHRVEARCRELNRFMREGLLKIPALKLLTPEQPELNSGMATFALDENKGRNAEIAGRLFKEHRIIVKAAQGTYAYVPDQDAPRQNYNALRFSTHIFNDEAQVQRTVELLARMLA